MKKILVTGASGYIGVPLIELLSKSNYDVSVVGRNKEKLRQLFPHVNSFSYKELDPKKLEFDYVIHLAVANNDKKISSEDFYKTNVKLLGDLLSFSKHSKVTKFFNLTSLHVFSKRENTYVKTKKKALSLIDAEQAFSICNIFLPAVYGDDLKGKLKILSMFPKKIRSITMYVLSSMVPVIERQRLCNQIVELVGKKKIEKDIFFYDDKNRNIIFKAIKISVDVSFALTVIVVFSWLLISISLLIKLNSRGTILFTQDRVGERGRIFKIYKFRTMKIGTKNVGTHRIHEESITSFGKILRKTKLDELPQVINILFGQMSLIGPRPGMPTQKSLFREREKRGVYAVKPGISGYSQLNNIDMSAPKKIAEWDQRYIAMRSIIFEFKLLLYTFTNGFGDRVKKK